MFEVSELGSWFRGIREHIVTSLLNTLFIVTSLLLVSWVYVYLKHNLIDFPSIQEI